MPLAIEKFQRDLLESVKQMRSGKAARVTLLKGPEVAEARAKVERSQQSTKKPEASK